MLHINDLVFRYGGRTLFSGATVHIAPGQKVGLVGRNGSGKTTLFRLIAGDLVPDGGSVVRQTRAQLGRLAQDMPEGSGPLVDYVLAADGERARLLAEAETEADPDRIGQIHERLAAIGAHEAPARAAAILAGLGFDAEAQARPLDSFSGGWRMRVALAAALFGRADLLLLDEPTNHLDLEASLWLEDHLARFQGTLLLISHDRDLLDRVAGRIVAIEDGRLVAYAGNYSRFECTRREKIDLRAKTLARQLEQRRRIQAFVDRFRAKATKARQAQSRLKLLEKMEVAAPIVEEQAISFDFPDPAELAPPLMTLDEVAVGYEPDQPILSQVSFRIDPDDRIALLGANGNGKSTLARLLTGRLAPQAGTLTRAPRLKVGYFAQHQAEEMDLAATPLLLLGRLAKDWTAEQCRAHLARFGFDADRVTIESQRLSGGEKARLLIALMCREAPHILVLDEPTNHLDIDSREALVQALNAFAGAVVLISHDPRLIELAADRLWLVADGRVRPFEGDLDEYRRFLLEQARTPKKDSEPGKAAGATRKDERRQAAQARARSAPLRQAAEAADAALEALLKARRELEAKMADPKTAADGAAMAELGRHLGALGKSIAEAEARWLAAHEALEQAS